MTERQCSKDSCENVGNIKKGLCSRHYRIWRKENILKHRECEVEACENCVYAKGMCQKHYHRVKKFGSIELPVLDTTCTIEGCETKRDAKGYCPKHYRRFKLYGDPLKLAGKKGNESHGMTGTNTYTIWKDMRKRCNNPSSTNFNRYGGRGISVCERWNKFENFIADMGERPSDNHSIDRIDNDGNYKPDNCQWATIVEQARNRSNNRNLTIYGKTMSMAEWHEIVAHETSYSAIKLRLYAGWSDKEAVFGKPKKELV